MVNFLMLTNILLKILRLPSSKVSLDKKGMVMILVDGLSYSTMVKAVDEGRMPFLKKLEKGGYKSIPYFAGIQAKTNFNEAELFYGKSKNISNFTWYDRKFKRTLDAANAASVEFFEKHFFKTKKPLLTKGSCVFGIYEGGATLSKMSAAKINLQKPLKTAFIFRLFILPLTNPYIFFLGLKISLRNITRGIYEAILKMSFRPFVNKIEETFLEIFLGEYTSYIAKIEFIRNTPVLFIDLIQYDMLVHILGNHATDTTNMLKLIDKYLKYIFKASKKSKRKYDFIVFSDHGQTPSIPFNKHYKISLPQYVEKIFNNQKNVIQTARIIDISKINPKKDILLLNSDSIAHIYFPESFEKPLTKDEIFSKYPNIIDRLLNHSGIGWLILRISSRRQILLGKKGNIIFQDGKILKSDGKPFLKELNIDNDTLLSLAEFANYNNNGDIVLLGNVINDKIVCFEDFKSAHGGIWGDMLKPFVCTDNNNLTEKIRKNNNYKNVYKEIRNLVESN